MTLILWLVAIYVAICAGAYFGNRLFMYFPDPTRVAPVEVGEDLSAESLPALVAPYWKAIGSGGSSGQPKVIVSAQPSVWDPEHAVLHMRPGQTFLNPGPLQHNASFFLSHAALFIGSHVVDLVKFDAERALQLIETHRANWVNLVPTMMHRIMRLPENVRRRYDVSSLQSVFHMAAPCPAWLKEAWIDWLGAERIWELYGATEGVGGAMIGGAEWLSHRGSVGKVDAESVAAFDGKDNRCPSNVVGEIFFKSQASPSYFYLGAEARNRGGWHSVGDLGRIDEEGYLYLADRAGDLIISGGVNIYPAEVEAAIDAFPGVCASAVIGLPDVDLGERAHAVVQIDPGEEIESRAVLDFLALRLARYKLPRSIEFTIDPLRNDAGKIRRSQLREERMGE